MRVVAKPEGEGIDINICREAKTKRETRKRDLNGLKRNIMGTSKGNKSRNIH